MTIEQLLLRLRTQLSSAARSGNPSVAAAQATLAQLEDEIALLRQRTADKEHLRLAAVVRHSFTPEEYYAAVGIARQAQPELWEGVWQP